MVLDPYLKELVCEKWAYAKITRWTGLFDSLCPPEQLVNLALRYKLMHLLSRFQFQIQLLAARKGRSSLLKEIYDQVYAEDLVDEAAKFGQLDIVKWLVLEPNNAPLHQTTMAFAASRGHLHVVQWLYEIDCPYSSIVMDWAARGGHLHIIEWLHSKNKECSSNTMDSAAYNGHLKVMKWLEQICGQTTTSKALYYAKEKNHHAVVEYLQKNDLIFLKRE